MGLFNKLKKKTFSLVSPISGTLINLSEVEDKVFSSKAMGDGFAIIPDHGEVVAPFDAEVVMIFPTKHAVGLKDVKNREWLIHFGMETVNLQGEGFISHVQAGQKVKQGDKLISVDLDSIRDKVPSLATPIILTNSPDIKVNILKYGKVSLLDDNIIELIV